MKIEGIISNWAGATVDYGCFTSVQAFAEVFHTFGIEITMEETRRPTGILKRDHIRTVLEMSRIRRLQKSAHGHVATEADINAMHDTFMEKLMNILDQSTDPKPYIVETIVGLQAMRLVIGSAAKYIDQVMAVVTHAAKEKGYAPDFWISPNSVDNHGRPYPYMISENLKQLHIHDMYAAVKVGDMTSDTKEGVAAGIISVGILEGSSLTGLMQTEYEALSTQEKEALCARLRKEYIRTGADYVVQDIRELPTLIQELSDKQTRCDGFFCRVYKNKIYILIKLMIFSIAKTQSRKRRTIGVVEKKE